MNIIMACIIGVLGGQLFNIPIRLHGKNLVQKTINIARGCVGIIVAVAFLAGSALGMQVSTIACVGLLIGWVGHIIEDLFNSKGCPILFPLTKKHFSIPILDCVKTRHWSEYVWLFIWIGVWVAWALLAVVGR